MKRIILLPLLLLFIGNSCTPELFKGMESQGNCTIKKSDLYPFSVKNGQTAFYSIELNMHNNVVNGLMMVEPDEKGDDVRIVCTSVFGTTLLDASINEKGMKIYSCIDQLKHKKVLRLLEKDFKTLFLKNLGNGELKAKAYKSYYCNKASTIANDTIVMHAGYKVKSLKAHNYYYKTNEVEQKLVNIASEGKITKSKIDLEYATGDFTPNKIRIEHPILKMSILLTRTE